MAPSSPIWRQWGHVGPMTKPLCCPFETSVVPRQARNRRFIVASKRKQEIQKRIAVHAGDSQTSDHAVKTTQTFNADLDSQTDKPTDGAGSAERFVSIRTLPLESSYDMAISSLLREIESLAAPGSIASPRQATPLAMVPAATIRIEVPLPRGMTSLQWLKSQSDKPVAVYFSSKMSSAPDTDGSLVAESSFSSMSAVAGLGHAWMWRGRHGNELDPQTMAEIAAMTDDGSAGGARGCDIKVLGGSRFDPGGAVGEEWAAFGSFCFLIPRIEYVERGNGCVLACTLAWDALAADVTGTTTSSDRDIFGFATLQDAVKDALRCIYELRGVKSRNSAGVMVAGGPEMVESMRHEPDAESWDSLMDRVQRELSRYEQTDGAGHSCVDSYAVQPTAALDEYLRNGQKGLDELLAASKTTPKDPKGQTLSDKSLESNGRTGRTNAGPAPSPLSGDAVQGKSKPGASAEGLVKLVLARKTTMVLDDEVDCCDLLEAIQEKDPKAYQFMLRLASGSHVVEERLQRTFLGCTPERLYCRTNRRVVSEAVAGTRGRGPGGDIEKDFWLAFDLLQSQKDGLEFQLVRESIVDTFEKLCEDVDLEVEKSVLKQGSVQHLYGRIAGLLKADVDDLDLVRELHPTPAVCGQPDQDAMCLLRSFESFDRGFYAGPFGWFSRNAADIAVAIRSSLVGADSIDLYAGVGIVPGSITSSEWNELDLKISQFTNLFKNSTRERIMSSQNVSILAAQVMVEELCRCGCNTFCIAPGSRSSPLTLAVAQHPRARLVPGIDERSLCFWALGHGKATGRPCAVITSSGTAVANLLPAVVEASQSDVPLLLLTADRPAELRDSGANQTIDQVGIFGKYVRWEADLFPPSADVPLRSTLAAVSNAVRIASLPSNSGPVHLNCQFREPLHPTHMDWGNQSSAGTGGSVVAPVVLQGLDAWIADSSRSPFTHALSSTAHSNQASTSWGVDYGAIHQIMTAKKGLIVVGELGDPDDVSAAKQIASYLRWPIVGDVLSGLRIGAGSGGVSRAQTEAGPALDMMCEDGKGGEGDFYLINHMDHVLLGGPDGSSDGTDWHLIKPDVILHLGSRLTSKRLLSFLEWATQHDDPATWILANRKTTRYDPANMLDVRLDCSIVDLYRALSCSAVKRPESRVYAKLLGRLDGVAAGAIEAALHDPRYLMSEAHVAKTISYCLPEGDGLFVGNSMPIRDLDMFGGPQAISDAMTTALTGAPIAANRGASGIDGVLSSAIGFADGLQRKCTLVIGDVSFIHDTNGLNLLRTGGMSPALTVVLINNSGGGIFNFLPIASGVPDEQFRPLWTTPQYVDISGMCRAQGIPHMRVTSLPELETSLKSSWALNRHCVLEVVTNIESNVMHHEDIKAAVSRALETCTAVHLGELGDRPGPESSSIVTRVRVKTVSFPLKQALTTSGGQPSSTRDVAYILMDAVCPDGTPWSVIGEIAPLPGLHRETIEEAVAQATQLSERITECEGGVPISFRGARTDCRNRMDTVDATRGRQCVGNEIGEVIQSLAESLGIALKSLYPSVTCGLEAALLQLHNANRAAPLGPSNADATHVSALLNPYGKSAARIAAEAKDIVFGQGYTCIKVKAGRSDDPGSDAAHLSIIRQAIGSDITLRVDANQAWTVAEAAAYVKLVADLDLEYLEEPLADPKELFGWDSGGVPIALDESIDQGVFDLLDDTKPLPDAVKVVVIKPSRIGGLSKTMALSRKAALRGLRTVISSSFESPTGLLHLSQIAQAVDRDNLFGISSHAHGISTASWFQGGYSGLTGHASESPGRHMPAIISMEYGETTSLQTGENIVVPVTSFTVTTTHVEWNVTQELSGAATSTISRNSPPIVLIHGMFGSASEMYGLAGALRAQCPDTPILCIDLPGHGQSRWTQAGLDALDNTHDTNMAGGMLNLLSSSLNELLLDERIGPCILVGYSLGARIALSAYHDIEQNQGEPGTVIHLITLSGGLGIATNDRVSRGARAAKDDAIANAFETLPRQEFFNTWYAATLWDSMRLYPGFENYVASKASQTTDPQHILATTLRGCSPGRAPALRDALAPPNPSNESTHSKRTITIMVGEQDATYMNMAASLDTDNNDRLTLVTVQGTGHAMHLEAPHVVSNLIVSQITHHVTSQSTHHVTNHIATPSPSDKRT